MKKKNLLQSIFVIAPIFISILINQSANAQIVYTKVSPDVKITCNKPGTSGTYPLDLNNDGVIDFNINAANSKTSCNNFTSVSASSLNGNSIVVYGVGYTEAAALKVSSLISVNSPWTTNQGATLRLIVSNASCPFGQNFFSGFWGGNNTYLGLKILNGGNTYYGWARIDVTVRDNSASFVVKEYAYDRTPNHSILAGAISGASFAEENSSVLSPGETEINPSQINDQSANVQGRKSFKCYDNLPGWGCGNDYTCGMYCSNFCATHPRTCKRMSESSNSDVTSFIDVYPNPVINSATILFSLDRAEKITLNILDLNGRLIKRIANEEMKEGEHEVQWNADDLNAGIYFLQFQSSEFTKTEKLVVTK